GLDHFEGRSWQGLHRHALMTMIAYPCQIKNGMISAEIKSEIGCSPRLRNLQAMNFQHHGTSLIDRRTAGEPVDRASEQRRCRQAPSSAMTSRRLIRSPRRRRSFEERISTGQECLWNSETYYLRTLQVNSELKLCRLLYG